MRQQALKQIDRGYKYNKIAELPLKTAVAKQKRVNGFLYTTLKLLLAIGAFIAAGNLLADWVVKL